MKLNFIICHPGRGRRGIGAFFWAGVGLWGAVLLIIVELSRRAYNDIIRYDHCESEEKQ